MFYLEKQLNSFLMKLNKEETYSLITIMSVLLSYTKRPFWACIKGKTIF